MTSLIRDVTVRLFRVPLAEDPGRCQARRPHPFRAGHRHRALADGSEGTGYTYTGGQAAAARSWR